jgi:hypothetical protein
MLLLKKIKKYIYYLNIFLFKKHLERNYYYISKNLLIVLYCYDESWYIYGFVYFDFLNLDSQSFYF